MQLNGFVVAINGGREKDNGYVEMKNNTQYTITLRNSKKERADAQLFIDGKEIGTFRVPGFGNITLERPLNDEGCFTFFKLGTREATAAGIIQATDELGLISVKFLPEKQSVLRSTYVENMKTLSHSDAGPEVYGNTSTVDESRSYDIQSVSTASAGGTGLSGHSNQSFFQVADLDYDYSRETIIYLRLIAVNEDIKPLQAKGPMSTPVPPPVN